MSLTPRETYEILDAGPADAIDQRFVRLYERNHRKHFKEMISNMRDRKALHQWWPLIEQSASVYGRKQFAITVPALITVIEGVLMVAEGDRTRPLPVVDKEIASLEARSADLFILALWRIAREFIAELYRKSDFSGSRPKGLNRHWILHGRDVAQWGQADSLRLFQAADTVSSLIG